MTAKRIRKNPIKWLDKTNHSLTRRLVKDYEDVQNNRVLIQYGLVAGWVSIASTFSLFMIKMILGLKAGSVSVAANAFHLLSHLANSVILVLSFKVAARPATEKNPFGHGRMEHIAPSSWPSSCSSRASRSGKLQSIKPLNRMTSITGMLCPGSCWPRSCSNNGSPSTSIF